jgi:endonuclease/exonuclease/phosphatase family metal-dependent hydrolase
MTTLRVLTFNLRGAGYPQDAPNTWANRLNLNLRTLRKVAPDLIGFQELQEANRATYQAELTEYASLLGTPSNEPNFFNYNSIYWNPQRLELLESGGMFLSETPEGWSKSWDSVFVRSVNWAHFRLLGPACRRGESRRAAALQHPSGPRRG